MSLHRKLNERERMAYASVARLERERDDLHAQLAERDALLRMVYLDEGTTDEKCARVEQIISATAEPSAPTKARNECEDCGDDGQTCTACAEPERKP